MRIMLMAVLGCLALCACSKPANTPRVVGYVDPYDYGNQSAYDVAHELGAEYVPSVFRTLSLPYASGSTRSLYAIVEYKDFKRGNIPTGFRGANTSELLAFMGTYGRTLDDDYVSICAPVGFFHNSVQMMAAASTFERTFEDGATRVVTRYGTRLKPGKGCNWALVLKEDLPQATS